jgi:hypothetical protein
VIVANACIVRCSSDLRTRTSSLSRSTSHRVMRSKQRVEYWVVHVAFDLVSLCRSFDIRRSIYELNWIKHKRNVGGLPRYDTGNHLKL